MGYNSAGEFSIFRDKTLLSGRVRETAVINSSATCFALQFASTSTRFDVIHLQKVPSCLSNFLLARHKNFSYIIQVMRTTKFVIMRTGP
jgi:hypothetical protein